MHLHGIVTAITGSADGMPAMGDSAVYLHEKAALKKHAAAAIPYLRSRIERERRGAEQPRMKASHTSTHPPTRRYLPSRRG